MSKIVIRAIPNAMAGEPQSIVSAIQALKEAVEILAGERGDQRLVTEADMVRLGYAKLTDFSGDLSKSVNEAVSNVLRGKLNTKS